MLDIKHVEMTSSACICNGRQGRLIQEWPWRDCTKYGGAVRTALDSKPWQYSGPRSLEKHSVMGITAIILNSDWVHHLYSLSQQHLKVYLHRINGVYAYLVRWSLYCSRSCHNASNHRLWISSATRWEFRFGRAKCSPKRTMTYTLSYDISCACCFHR